MKTTPLWTLYILMLFATVTMGFGQAVNEQGIKPYGSYQGGDLDDINVSNGHLELHIPLLEYPQRGHLKLNFIARYHNAVWLQKKDCASGGVTLCLNEWNFDQSPGIQVITEQMPPLPEQQLVSDVGGVNPIYAYSLRLSDESQHAYSSEEEQQP